MKQMFEKPSKEVSERMKKVKSRDTGLEKAMEEILDSLHIAYDKQPNLVGHPDFRIKETNVLIFCDSSFWHGRRELEITGEAFKKNRNFWTEKLIENKKKRPTDQSCIAQGRMVGSTLLGYRYIKVPR